MKNKKTGKKSISVVVDVKNSKIVKKSFNVAEGSIIDLPISMASLTLRGVILQHRATIDSLKHLSSIMEEENDKDSMSMSAIRALKHIIRTKKHRDSLELLGDIFKTHPELEGYAIAFNDSITQMKLEDDDGCSRSLAEVESEIMSIDIAMKVDENGKYEAIADAIKSMENLDMPFSKKLSYAKTIAKSKEIMRKSDENPESCTKEDVEMLKSAVDVAEDLAKMMIDSKEGGIA